MGTRRLMDEELEEPLRCFDSDTAPVSAMTWRLGGKLYRAFLPSAMRVAACKLLMLSMRCEKLEGTRIVILDL